jgi:hypothetical protein
VSLRVGVVVVQNLPYDRWRARVLEVEELGYDGVYVWDHLVHRTQAPTDPLFDGLTLLAAAAEFTSRLRLGTLVASPTLRHPVLLAKQAMTLDNLSGGRVELGIGAAGVLLDYQVLGMEPWSRRSRCSASGDGGGRGRGAARRLLVHRRPLVGLGGHDGTGQRAVPPAALDAGGPRAEDAGHRRALRRLLEHDDAAGDAGRPGAGRDGLAREAADEAAREAGATRRRSAARC